jgi:UDP-N-acetylglucosamine--N-acetylmuramyl-(pentapeptide) pyrophosphoryl-undecaprenol N-acetylglucosamine transferase
MNAPLRVVFYAVNGTGVGHVTRLLSIARWLRRYAAALGRKIECWFLTSSEADSLVFSEGFAAFKIPSKTIVAETGIDRIAYRALAKQWIWHTLALLRPDLLVVDTFPRGSFGELLGALDLCRNKAFVYRPVRNEVAARADFQSMLPLYDLLLVPEVDAPVLAPKAMQSSIVHVGTVLSRERWELTPREEARKQLGISPEQRCVYISAGGGGAPEVSQHLAAAVHAFASDPRFSVVVGSGPLYRGPPLRGVTTMSGAAAEWSLAFDVAVAAAGYNTYGELMFAGVPTVFLPQSKLADDQGARAQHAVDAGAAVLLEDLSQIRQAAMTLMARAGASEAARSLVPENGARNAAAELLRLVVPPRDVDVVESTLDDALMASLPRATELDILRLARRLARGCEDDMAEAIEATRRLFALAFESTEGASMTSTELRRAIEAVSMAGAEPASIKKRAAAVAKTLGLQKPRS